KTSAASLPADEKSRLLTPFARSTTTPFPLPHRNHHTPPRPTALLVRLRKSEALPCSRSLRSRELRLTPVFILRASRTFGAPTRQQHRLALASHCPATASNPDD